LQGRPGAKSTLGGIGSSGFGAAREIAPPTLEDHPMSYLNCPRCALSIRIRADYLAMTNCPRCMGRNQVTIPLYETPRPARVSLFRRPATRGPADGRA